MTHQIPPTWVNGGPPARNATNLNILSDNQRDHEARLATVEANTIDTVALLKGATGIGNGEYRYLAGYTAVGDGGEGIVRRNTSLSSFNEGTTFGHNTASGGWERVDVVGKPVNVRWFGANTSAIDAAANYAATNVLPLDLTAGNYTYNGSGIALSYAPIIRGAGREVTNITLGAGCSLINSPDPLDAVLISDMTFFGGQHPLRFTNTSVNVASARSFERLGFFDYTGAAISNEGNDNPYWQVDQCQFRGVNSTTTMGVALHGFSDASVITRSSFERNRIGVKLVGNSGQDVTIDRCAFLRFDTYAGTSRADVWIVPQAPTTYSEGAGFRVLGTRFSNEGLDVNDDRILLAAEGSGTNTADKFPATTQSTGVVVGMYVGAGSWASGAGSSTGPFIRTRTADVFDCEVDIQWAATMPGEFVHYDYLPTPTSTFGSARATNRIHVRDYFPTSSSFKQTVRGSNAPGYWMVGDPLNIYTPAEGHSPVATAGDPTGYSSLFVGAASALSLLGSVTTVAATDALGGTDAVEATFSDPAQLLYAAIAPTQGRGMWLELDLKSGATSSVTYARFGIGLNSVLTYARTIQLTSAWTRYRIPLIDHATSNFILIGAAGDSGKLQVGRIMCYHAREPVPGKQIPTRNTTGLSSAQIDALVGVVPVDGGPPIYDPTQGRFLHRVGGKWRYVATTQIA